MLVVGCSQGLGGYGIGRALKIFASNGAWEIRKVWYEILFHIGGIRLGLSYLCR